jgi:ABC-type thiamin/hydroxymethylpyrimidine transport system permease subunit
MKMFLAALVAVMMTGQAQAKTVNSGYVGCITGDDLSEFVSAAVNNDNRHMDSLLGNVCFAIGGLDFSMVDQGFMTSEIKVYVGNDSFNLFVPAEAAR